VISIRNGLTCKRCGSNVISISEGDANPEQELQRSISYEQKQWRIKYVCLDCDHEGYIVFDPGTIES